MGLLEEDSRQRSLNKMTQDLTRFLLQTMADDYRIKSPTPAAMEQVSRARLQISSCILTLSYLDFVDLCFDDD